MTSLHYTGNAMTADNIAAKKAEEAATISLT